MKIKNRGFNGFFAVFWIISNVPLNSGQKIDTKVPLLFWLAPIRPFQIHFFPFSDPFSSAFLEFAHPISRGSVKCVGKTEIRASIWYQSRPGIHGNIGVILKTKPGILSSRMAQKSFSSNWQIFLCERLLTNFLGNPTYSITQDKHWKSSVLFWGLLRNYRESRDRTGTISKL